MVSSIKITKRNLTILIIILIIVAALLVYFLILYPKQQKEKGIEQYKKALYESVLCQYRCPLENLTVLNQTQLLPSKKCVGDCIQQLKDKGYAKSQYTDAEIMQDNLAQDIENVVVNCRAVGANNETNNQYNKQMINCSINSLEGLKQNYTYLN